MKKYISECCNKRTSESWCRLNDECVGWGCRLLLCIPNKLPTTEKERASLFSKVYEQAEKSGILKCPYYDELAIDRAVEDKEILRSICSLKSGIQTCLLSEENTD